MNESLEVYKDEEKVWHISGWNYLINNGNLRDVFLWDLWIAGVDPNGKIDGKKRYLRCVNI
mgnify:CR=1 FL=1